MREDEHAFQSSHARIDNWENIKPGGKTLASGLQVLFRGIKAALQEGRTVVFDRRQGRVALMFLPKDDSYECWHYESPSAAVNGNLDVRNDPKAFLLVDPSGRAANQRGCGHSHYCIVEHRTLSTICEEPTLPNNVYGQLEAG
jgi:hypothetical protein